MNESRKHVEKLSSKRLKQGRIALGLSQKDLGKVTEISTQQIQKYEEGLSKIPVSRLYVFAKILNTPLKYFIDSSEKTEKEIEIEYLFKEPKNKAKAVAEEDEKYKGRDDS